MNATIRIARLAGFLYLVVAITGFFTPSVVDRLLVPGDMQATAHNVLASAPLYRAGFLSAMLMTVAWIGLGCALYVLFRPYGGFLPVTMLSLVLVGAAVACMNSALEFGVMALAGDAGPIATALLGVSAMLREASFVFFGLWMAPLAYLIISSKLFPKIPGIILGTTIGIAAAGYIMEFAASLYAPGHSFVATKYSYLGEVLLLLWLIVKGVKVSDSKRVRA